MFVVAYRTAAEDEEWHVYKCATGKFAFELYTANFRCRALVRAGVAVEAKAQKGETVGAHWVLNAHTRRPQQLSGPDL